VLREVSSMTVEGLDALTYQQHARRLMAIAAGLVGPSDAEDIVSAAMVRVMTSPAWTNVVDPGAYLTRAVVNEARSMLRSSRRRSSRETRFVPATTHDLAEPGDPVLLRALMRLPLRQRAVIVLTYWADMTPEVVAEQLGISEGSARKHLARARATLRKELS
jgi:RNA polymerase sigma factor (sigma-70 family)